MSVTRAQRRAPLPSFVEVKPLRTSKEFRAYVDRALDVLKATKTPLAQQTYRYITRSEEHYRGPTQGLLEEYRAFYVEKLFAGVEMTPGRCQALKASIAKDYGFTKAHLDQIPDLPPGLLVPPR